MTTAFSGAVPSPPAKATCEPRLRQAARKRPTIEIVACLRAIGSSGSREDTPRTPFRPRLPGADEHAQTVRRREEAARIRRVTEDDLGVRGPGPNVRGHLDLELGAAVLVGADLQRDRGRGALDERAAAARELLRHGRGADRERARGSGGRVRAHESQGAAGRGLAARVQLREGAPAGGARDAALAVRLEG